MASKDCFKGRRVSWAEAAAEIGISSDNLRALRGYDNRPSGPFSRAFVRGHDEELVDIDLLYRCVRRVVRNRRADGVDLVLESLPPEICGKCLRKMRRDVMKIVRKAHDAE